MKPDWTKAEVKNVSPSTAMINAIRQRDDLDLSTCVSEVVANSLDQESTVVRINYDGERLIVWDNGRGCTDLQSMYRLGQHTPNNVANRVGRFGVGFKDAAIWCGFESAVESWISPELQCSARSDWRYMEEVGDWELEFVNGSERDEVGTTVIISELIKERFSEWPRVPTDLAMLYSGAIRAGVKIVVNGDVLKPFPFPILTDRVEINLSFDGRKVRGFAGILAEKRESGWEVQWGTLTIHRAYRAAGFKGSCNGFYGFLDLIDDHKKWTLSTHKRKVTELARFLTSEALQQLIEPILKKLQDRPECLQIKLNERKLAQILSQLWTQRRPVTFLDEKELLGRGPTGNGHGGHGGNGTGTGDLPRPKRTEDPSSKIHRRLPRARILTIHRHTDPDNHGLGFVEFMENGSVTIYVDSISDYGEFLWTDRQKVKIEAIHLFTEALILNPEAREHKLPKLVGAGSDLHKISQLSLRIAEAVLDLK